MLHNNKLKLITKIVNIIIFIIFTQCNYEQSIATDKINEKKVSHKKLLMYLGGGSVLGIACGSVFLFNTKFKTGLIDLISYSKNTLGEKSHTHLINLINKASDGDTQSALLFLGINWIRRINYWSSSI